MTFTGLTALSVETLMNLLAHGRPADVAGTEDVVGYGLRGLQLHHRHVLVGRGVEGQPAGALEDEAHALGDRDVANEDLRVVEVLAPELLVQVVEPALVSIEQYQASRTEARDLAKRAPCRWIR